MEKEDDIQMVMPNDMLDFYDRAPILSEKIWKRMSNKRFERIKSLLYSADIILESVISCGVDIVEPMRKIGMFSLFPTNIIGGVKDEGFCLAVKVGPIGLPEHVGEDIEFAPYMMWFTSEGIVLFSMERDDSNEPLKGMLFKDAEELSQRSVFLPSGIPEGRTTSAGLMAKEWLFRFSDTYMLPESAEASPSKYSDLTIIEGGDRLSLSIALLCADALAKGVAEKGLPVADTALFAFYMLCIDMEYVSAGSFSHLLNGKADAGHDLLRHVFRREDISALESAVRNTFGYARNPDGNPAPAEKRTPKNEIGLRKAEEEPIYISRKELSLYFDPMPRVLSNTLKGMTEKTHPETKIAGSSHPEWNVSEKTRFEKYYEYLCPHLLDKSFSENGDPVSMGSALKEFVKNIDDIARNQFVEKLSLERKKYYEDGSGRFGKASERLLETVDPGYMIDEGIFQRRAPTRDMNPSEKPYFFRSELQSLAVRAALQRKGQEGNERPR